MQARYWNFHATCFKTSIAFPSVLAATSKEVR